MSNDSILLICSESTIAFYQSLADNLAPHSHLLISNEKKFEPLESAALISDYGRCFVEVELGWSGKEPKDCFGFAIARALRQKGLRCAIFFCTYRNLSFFDAQNPKYALLQASQWHQLISLPASIDTFLALHSRVMNQVQWEDVVDTLTEIRFLVQEVLHDLKNAVIGLPNGDAFSHRQNLKKVVENKFIELRRLLPDKLTSLQNIQELMLKHLLEEAGPGGRPQAVIESFTQGIINISPEPEFGDDSHSLPKTRWQVLFVDDEPQLHAVMAEGFERDNISYLAVSNGEDALKTLRADTKKTISVLLCDIRLKDMDTGIWETYQGYDIIQEARLLPNYLSFAALTSARKRIRRLQQQFPFVSAFYKKDVLETNGGMNIFLQKIRELGDAMFFKSRNRPVLKSWTSHNPKFGAPLSMYYREHLFSSGYDEAEAKLNQAAKKYVDNALSGKSYLNERIPFTGTFTSPPSDPEALDSFRNRILFGRRIALALWYHQKPNPKALYNFIRPDEEFTEEKYKQLFNTFFCLSFSKDLPTSEQILSGNYLGARLLEEEVRWLVDTYSISFELSAIQQNRLEVEAICDTLQGLQDMLRGKQAKEAVAQKKLNTFMATDFDSLVITEFEKVEELVKTADSLARLFDPVLHKFHSLIRMDLEGGEYQHPKLKKIMENILK